MSEATSRKEMSVGEFVVAILASNISEAQKLIDGAKKGLPAALWASFCNLAATENTIGNLVDRIARGVNSCAELHQPAHALFDVIRTKAEDLGETVDVDRIIGVYNL